MKKMLFALAATLLLFVSCNGNSGPDNPAPDDGAYVGTVSVGIGTDDAFTLEDTRVVFTVHEGEATADIEMMQVKFAITMPVKLNVLIEGVTLTPATDGYSVSCGADGIVPSAMNGQPFPNYTMTEIDGTVTTQTMSISMMCGPYPLSFTGTRSAE